MMVKVKVTRTLDTIDHSTEIEMKFDTSDHNYPYERLEQFISRHLMHFCKVELERS